MDETMGAGTAARAAATTDLGALQGVIFEELNRLLSLDRADPDAMAREVVVAQAVGSLAGVAIDNANTVLRVVQVRDQLSGERRRLPKMISAGE